MPSEQPRVPHVFVRGIARAVDLVVQLAVLEVAFRSSAAIGVEPLFTLSDDGLLVVDVVVGVSSLVLYTAVAEWWGGATLGKALTRIRVRTVEGERIGLTAALVRGLAFLVDGLFLGFVAYTVMAREPDRRRLGDLWAGTRVVPMEDAPGAPVHVGWVVGVLAAFTWVLTSYLLAA